MQTSSKKFIDLLINEPNAGTTKLAAGEIIRVHEGVQEVIEGLRAGRDAELCARRLEMLLGLRNSLNDSPGRRSARKMPPYGAIAAKPTARPRKKSAK